LGIDIYAEWNGMSDGEHAAQDTAFSVEHGHVGYLREAYHGEPYATKILVPEAFETGRALISAKKSTKRLPEALAAAEERERGIYRVTDAKAIGRVLKSYRDFVALCERKERETGRPCLIIASY
jgi:hypothetical protein